MRGRFGAFVDNALVAIKPRRDLGYFGYVVLDTDGNDHVRRWFDFAGGRTVLSAQEISNDVRCGGSIYTVVASIV